MSGLPLAWAKAGIIDAPGTIREQIRRLSLDPGSADAVVRGGGG